MKTRSRFLAVVAAVATFFPLAAATARAQPRSAAYEAGPWIRTMLSAAVVAGLSLAFLRRLGVRALDGSAIGLPPKAMGGGYRYWIGGTSFGVGWALTGACPGPLFALLGSGVAVIAVTILGALAGTWVYGALRPRLPH